MKNLGLAISIISFAISGLNANEIYTLDSLQSLARIQYPQAKQLPLIDKARREAIRNINSGYIPKINVTGALSYQSEVPLLPPSVPISMPSSPKDLGKTGIEVSQLLTDCGVSMTQRSIEKLNSKNDSLKVETDLLKIRSQINSTFTDIAIAKENGNILNYTRADLEARKGVLETAVNAGTVLSSTLQELNADILSINEKVIDNNSRINSLYSTLSKLVNKTIDTSAVLQLPQPDTVLNDDITARPDYGQIEIQKQLCDRQIVLINRSAMPKVSLFGNAYYGRGGYNIYDTDPHFYGMSGVNLTWPIGGSMSNIAQKQKLVITKDILGSQKNTLELSLKIQLSKLHDDITKFQQMIILDDEILKIRSQVKATAVAQVESGAITVADYTTKLDAEGLAIANKKIHLIQLAMAYIEYQTTIGNRDRRK